MFTDGTNSFISDPLAPALKLAREQGISINVVALKTPELNESILRQIASETGGSYSVVEQPKQLLRKFQDVAAQLSKPVYRLAVTEPIDASQPIQLQVADLKPILVSMRE